MAGLAGVSVCLVLSFTTDTGPDTNLPHTDSRHLSHICKDTIDAKRSGIHLSNPPLLVTWYLGRFIDQLEPPPSSLSYPTPTNELGPSINCVADVNRGQRYMVIKYEKEHVEHGVMRFT